MTTQFDIIIEGKTPVKEKEDWQNIVSPYKEAGATWWIEAMWELTSKEGDTQILERIRAGPPK